MYNIGIPVERKLGEGRVALTPYHVEAIIQKNPGIKVYVETNAGKSAGFSNEDYTRAGAIVGSVYTVYSNARLIVKVKEPNQFDLQYLNDSHILFCYFHLAAFPHLTKILLERKVTCIAFESVSIKNRYGQLSLPLLFPMSKIAGKLAIHMANDVLRTELGEVLNDAHRVLVVGAGTVGFHAVSTADGDDPYIEVFDVNQNKLDSIQGFFPSISTFNIAEDPTIFKERLCNYTNDVGIVVCGALVPDDKAPKLITKEMIDTMQGPEYRSTVFVDVSIDQGGCIEGIEPTNLIDRYKKIGKHYFIAIPNMPGSVPKTSSELLANAIYPYVDLMVSNIDTDELVHREDLVEMFESLHAGTIIKDGVITNDTLKTLFGKRGELI